ncbi:alpha/beta hydrolase [Clostridium sp. HBUAS56017]|uniref:alpha/beta hydrolase n=1 Tax=Clostridium sp. HBUAS56017 TaxID=2571128 RepID=UPI001178CB6C|nr:alpha/beta hydrolase [Clostridium sp. HBUAS56017]
MSKVKKVLLIIISVVLVLALATIGVAGNYFYNLALNPKTSKEKVFGTKDKSVEASNVAVSNWITDKSGYKDAFIDSIDDLQLHGYEIINTNPSKTWVITVHGYMGQGKEMEGYANAFYNMGYNVLVPDLRGHGKSEGKYIGMGWDDRKDILSWIDYILQKDSDANIVLHGVSMGGGTVMMTSGEDLPGNVKAIIEDCGYTSVWDEFSYQLDSLFGLPEFPVLQSASLVSKIRAGYWLQDASAIDQLAKSKTPMLFIHGDKDTFVPYSMLDKVYNSANVEKEKLVVEGAAHAQASKTNPQLYWGTIRKFIKNYIAN